MRDFPMFTTENGAAALIFREVPYRGEAYIRIHSSESFPAFLKECTDFALAVGAEKIYAAGHPELQSYPFHTAIYRLAAPKEGIPEPEAFLFPVMPQTLSRFREIYNARMEKVPSSAYMTQSMAEEMLRKGEGYFVHDGERLLGIGMISGDEIKALAACCPGAGSAVLRTLCHAVTGEVVTLETASENKKAMALYRQEGFALQKTLSRWYRVK